MANGIIYVLVNPSMPGVVKVGKTTNEATARAAQLSSGTGVPTKFEVYKEYLVKDCHAAERYAHSLLEKTFGRPSPSREFFEGSPEEVTAILDDALSTHLQESPSEHVMQFKRVLDLFASRAFSLACLEFENALANLSITPLEIDLSPSLREVSAAYFASCFMTKRIPKFMRVIMAPRVRGAILERAIELATEFESDPTMELINFARTYQDQ
ncbi:MAG: GIY-YIG nuclease family protein [Gammaproteobacteria bacterium]|nr:GIY-YIG nuclease family protein [Gammaproteobacteria bacterium]